MPHRGLFLVGAIVMAFRQCFLETFFDTAEVTKIVLPKVLQNFRKAPNCTRWPNELNQKGLPRNIQYRARPKATFSFFRHCETFFGQSFYFVLSQRSQFSFACSVSGFFQMFQHIKLFLFVFFSVSSCYYYDNV